MLGKFNLHTRNKLLAEFLLGSFVICMGLLPAAGVEQNPAPSNSAASAPSGRSSFHAARDLPASARNFYQGRWGVDMLSVKAIDSGLLVRFNYRVVNAKKAAALNEKIATPYLIDEKARVKLVVPNLEKVGELRDKAEPEEGKVYWMVFSNKGKFVKPGHRVSVEIGKFRVDGLVVQ